MHDHFSKKEDSQSSDGEAVLSTELASRAKVWGDCRLS